MRQVKTAKGKSLDMAALAKKHEDERAVSNVPINAKGDRLDEKGNVKATVQSIARAQMEMQSESEMVGLGKTASKSSKKQKDDPLLPVETSRTIKTRDDGSQYEEIEYDDGNIETIEITAKGNKK